MLLTGSKDPNLVARGRLFDQVVSYLFFLILNYK